MRVNPRGRGLLQANTAMSLLGIFSEHCVLEVPIRYTVAYMPFLRKTRDVLAYWATDLGQSTFVTSYNLLSFGC